MSSYSSALLLALWAAFAVSACNHEDVQATVQIASTPACLDSEDGACENGKPLCAIDNARACLMCRCVVHPPLPSDDPNQIIREGALGGNTPTPYAARP